MIKDKSESIFPNKPSYALITGASSGIGAEFARQLAGRGHNLILVARREDKLIKLANELSAKHNIKCETVIADLSDTSDVKRIEERITDGGDVEILVNNAGFGIRGFFNDTNADDQERMIYVHCTAPMRLTRAALPSMIAKKHGVIINVSSIAGFAPAPGNVNYHATKAYLIGMTESLHLELGGSGVYVQALCPGFTYSEFHDVIKSDRRAVERKWWMQAEDVVGESLREVFKNKPSRTIVVPGTRYRRLLNIVHILPRAWLWKISLKRSSRIGKRRKELESRQVRSN